MKQGIPDPRLEDARIRSGEYGSNSSYRFMGAFLLYGPKGTLLKILSSGPGEEWEHVSVSISHRIPNWEEMCFVKSLFWDDEEAVMQLHPPKSDYVNCHPNCLHLWKPTKAKIPLPPSLLVGPKP